MRNLRLILKISLLFCLALSSSFAGVEWGRLNGNLKSQLSEDMKSTLDSKVGSKDILNSDTFLKDLKQDEAESFKKDMQAIDPSQYETKGIEAMNSEENKGVKSMLFEHQQYKLEDNDPIFKVYDSIKESPVKDCKETLATTDSPTFKMLKEQRKVINTEFEKNLCEHLANQYSCNLTLNLRCQNEYFEGAPLKNVSLHNGLEHNYDGSKGKLRIARKKLVGLFGGVAYYSRWGEQIDYHFTFDVDKTEVIDRFTIDSVHFADYVLIKLNGNVVFAAPSWGVSSWMSFSKHTTIKASDDKWYNVVVSDKGTFCANTKTYSDARPGVDIKQYLKQGQNTLEMRLIYAGGGALEIDMSYLSKKCGKWIETWDETCTHISR